MARKVLISLVGGRPLPNVQFILNEKPNVLYLIASKDSAGKAGNKEKLIEALPDNLKPKETFDANPYLITETINICEKILSMHSGDDIVVQLSSEPTTMALGAYQFVIDNRTKNAINLYYSSRDGVINIFDNTRNPEKLSISLNDYFKVYGWNVAFKNTTQTDLNSLVDFFVENLKTTQRLLSRIRNAKTDKSNEDSNTYLLANLEPEQVTILTEMKLRGYIVDFKENVLYIDKNKATFFDTGDWLEYYVYKSALSLNFDECAWNVNDENKKGELDFVGIYSGQLVLVSCKTERLNSQHVQQLSARAEQLGKGMCSKLMVTSDTPSNQEIANYKKWKDEYNIDFVYGDDLLNITDKIKRAKEDTKSRI